MSCGRFSGTCLSPPDPVPPRPSPCPAPLAWAPPPPRPAASSAPYIPQPGQQAVQSPEPTVGVPRVQRGGNGLQHKMGSSCFCSGIWAPGLICPEQPHANCTEAATGAVGVPLPCRAKAGQRLRAAVLRVSVVLALAGGSSGRACRLACRRAQPPRRSAPQSSQTPASRPQHMDTSIRARGVIYPMSSPGPPGPGTNQASGRSGPWGQCAPPAGPLRWAAGSPGTPPCPLMADHLQKCPDVHGGRVTTVFRK